MRKVVLTDAGTGVRNTEAHHTVIIARNAYLDFCFSGGILQGIRQEVEEHFLQIVGREVHLQRLGRRLHPQGQPLLSGQVGKTLYKHLHHRQHVAMAEAGGRCGMLATGQVEELRHQPEQSVHLALYAVGHVGIHTGV